MDLLASFTADRELTVIAGQREIGSVSPLSVTRVADGGVQYLLLAGRSWYVESIDWEKKRIQVSEDSTKGRAKWASPGAGESYALCRAQRDVVLGVDVPGALSQRAARGIARVREDLAPFVSLTGNVLEPRGNGDARRYWTWAGQAANATLAAALDVDTAFADKYLDLPPGVGMQEVREVSLDGVMPKVDERAASGLKFAAAVPRALAVRTVGLRARATVVGGSDEYTVDTFGSTLGKLSL